MKPVFISCMVMLVASLGVAHAQDYNPFKAIGKKGKIITASNGKFDEIFDTDSVQRIGSVLININTKKIVKLINSDTAKTKYSDNSSQSRWYSIDPMTEGQEQWSPYHFAYDNPIRFNDPDGRVPGDFYDEQGNKLGTDGKADGKVYVVTNPKDVQTVQSHTNATSQGGTTQVSQLSSTPVELPSATVRQQMGAAVTRSNNPSATAGDATGGMHEEGGVYGKDPQGNDVVMPSKPGQASDPNNQKGNVGVNPTAVDVQANTTDGRSVLQNGYTASTMTVTGTFHVHPKGAGTNRFVQPPSNADLNNSVYRANTMNITGNSYVLGAGSNKVYIYTDVNGQGKQIAEFPLSQFVSIK